MLAAGDNRAAAVLILESLADGMPLDCSGERGKTSTNRRLGARNPCLSLSMPLDLFTTARTIPL